MKTSNDNDVNEQSLLSDPEFVALMDAEYQAEKPLKNDIEQNTMWKDIERRISKSSPIMARPWARWLSAMAAAVILVPMVWLALLSPEDSQRFKGEASSSVPVLSSYLLSPDGQTRIIGNGVQPGDTLVFKIGATEPMLIGIAISVNQHAYSLRFKSEELAAGMEQLVTHGGNTYGYAVEKADQSLSVCALNLNDKSENLTEPAALAAAVKRLPIFACATFYVNGVPPT